MQANTQTTRSHLLAHAAAYPQAQAQDYMKFLFQSAFGCEHLIADPLAAAAYIRREAASAVPHPGDMIEPLDGPFCRVHLDVLKDGLAPETLAALFACSAEHQNDGAQLLEEKLAVFEHLVQTGELPLDPEQTARQLEDWQKAGYPACHHSEAFRAAYHPAYRLLKAAYVRFLPVFAAIDRQLAAKERLIVAIDGGSASGKTTLASLLNSVYGCNVFHMDDFFLRPEQRTPERYAEPGGNVDRERFQAEVLTPLLAGETVQLRRFDCHTMTIQAPECIQPTPLTVIEGSYSLHPALRDSYQLRIFLRIDPAHQASRILARNGEEGARMFMSRWVPLEQEYAKACRPDLASDLIIDI